MCEEEEVIAEISGKMRFEAQRPSDYPAVGDFVMLDRLRNSGGHAIIHHILPRTGLLRRKSVGGQCDAQVVAANIDIVFICMSLNEDFNLRRLERYQALSWESGATPVVVLTKADLCEDVQRKVHAVNHVALGVDVIVTSSIDEDSYNNVEECIKPGKTIALIGSSGVGKSTLVNHLLYEERLKTKEIREKDGRGRHATTRRELFHLPNGGIVIDTPGMREIGMWESTEGIDKTFSDVEALFSNCRFSDCTHTSEPGCAIHEALEQGELSHKRWMSYRKLMVETSYQDEKDTYLLLKEKKFKDIAKLNKQGKKKKMLV
jgi:ribosome biogenesis GTPase